MDQRGTAGDTKSPLSRYFAHFRRSVDRGRDALQAGGHGFKSRQLHGNSSSSLAFRPRARRLVRTDHRCDCAGVEFDDSGRRDQRCRALAPITSRGSPLADTVNSSERAWLKSASALQHWCVRSTARQLNPDDPSRAEASPLRERVAHASTQGARAGPGRQRCGTRGIAVSTAGGPQGFDRLTGLGVHSPSRVVESERTPFVVEAGDHPSAPSHHAGASSPEHSPAPLQLAAPCAWRSPISALIGTRRDPLILGTTRARLRARYQLVSMTAA